MENNRIRIATLTSASLISRKRKMWLSDLIRTDDIDIPCIQETKIPSVTEEEELTSFFKQEFQVFHPKAQSESGRPALFVRREDGLHVIPDIGLDSKGRVSFVDLAVGSGLIRILSLYASNESRDRRIFFSNLQDFVDTTMMCLVAGVFNCILRARDRFPPCRANVSGAKELGKVTLGNDLCDVATEWDGKAYAFTHWQNAVHSRLDRIYLSKELPRDVVSYNVKPVAFSDHALIVWDLGSLKRNASNGHSAYWKLNDTVWDNQEFSEAVAGNLRSLLRNGADACSWENCKHDLRLAAIAQCKAMALTRKASEGDRMRMLLTFIHEEERAPVLWVEDIKACKKRLLLMLEQCY